MARRHGWELPAHTLQGTGVFVDGPGAGKHLQARAKKVIITAPPKGAEIPTYVVGVNEQDYSHEVADIIRFDTRLMLTEEVALMKH